MQDNHPIADIVGNNETFIHEVEAPSNTTNRITITSMRYVLWHTKNKQVTEFAREDLSSIDYSSSSNVALAILLFCVAGGLLLMSSEGSDSSMMMFIALTIAVVGILLLNETEQLRLWVRGRAGAITISKTRYVWDSPTTSLRSLLQLRFLVEPVVQLSRKPLPPQSRPSR